MTLGEWLGKTVGKLHTACLSSPCLFWVTMALGFLALDLVLAHCAVLGCDAKPSGTTTVLVASDPHFSEVCPFAGTWMRHLMDAAVSKWEPDAVVVTGDILNNVGGESSALNVSTWWYDALALQVKRSMQCDRTTCHFAPGNHDLELNKYHHRYVKHFGWPHCHRRAGNADLYLFNSMDPNGTLAEPKGPGPVDFLFAHHPAQSRYIEFQPSASFLNTIRPRWIITGHAHKFNPEHSVELRGWQMKEVTVPSLCFYRSRRDGGRTGVVLLHKAADGSINTQLCEPWERGILIAVRVVLAATLIYLHCRNSNVSKVSIAKSLCAWLLLLLGLAYILLAFFGWFTLVWACAAACLLLLWFHWPLRDVAYNPLESEDISPVLVRTRVTFEL